jgi:guanylate kinase
MENIRFSVSHTTRQPRAGEKDGIEYFFVSPAEFEAMIRKRAFLEHAHVYGNYYGTTKGFVDSALDSGIDVLLDIDVQGAGKVRNLMPEAISVFVLPPSFQELEQRLRDRGLDDPKVIEGRLEAARREIGNYKDYDYVVVNEVIENSVNELKSIVSASHCRLGRREAQAEEIVKTFFLK